MKAIFRSKATPYVVAFVIAALIAVGIYVSRGLSAESTAEEQYRALCDAFTVPGVIMLAFGVLLWVSGEGALTGVTWLLHNAIYMLIPGKGLQVVSYRDYLEERRTREKKTHPCFFAVGGFFLVVALVFLIIYSNVV